MSAILRIAGLIVVVLPLGRSQAPIPATPLSLTLADAMNRARQYSQQVYSARIAAQLAHEDTIQARAAMLPSVTALSQFNYTQPNGTDSGVFVSADGPHVYTDQAIVHTDILNPVRRAEYHRALAAEAVARARSDLAVRGLVSTVVQNYYGIVAAERKLAQARQSLTEAENLLDITRKQEAGGEVAHADVIKAQIVVEQRRRELQEAQLAVEKARIGFGVLLFPNFGQEFTVADDLETAPVLPPFPEIQALANRNSPDIRAAHAVVEQQTHAASAARAALLPSVSLDYFFGINANQLGVHNPDHQRNLGSALQAQVSIPVWNWGAARSRMRQAALQVEQARSDLSLTERQLVANLNQFYQEARVAGSQLDSLRLSSTLSAESLRLTLLRYQAGEVTVLELVDAQTTAAQARSALLEGLVRYRVALANLQTLTGGF